MKRTLFVFLALFLKCYLSNAQVFVPPATAVAPGSWYSFRSVFEVTDTSQVRLAIAADSKYWLWINGRLQVFEGGLKRGPNPQDTYYDVLTHLPAITSGQNRIDILVWYFGKDGFSHRSSPTPGIWVEMKEQDQACRQKSPWMVCRHPAYYIPEGDIPNFRLSESNIGFDANESFDPLTATGKEKEWTKASSVSLSEAGWNELVERPIPQWKDYGLKNYAHVHRVGDTLFAELPYNAQITPYFKINAPKGVKIDIRTDNYEGGSDKNVHAEYITRPGEQEYESFGWMNGHFVRYLIPDSVEIIDLKYRETGYATEFSGYFQCDDPALNRIWNKAQRTLYLTMRDTYMDCPDRERSQWWGDVVNELGEAFYALDSNAHLLTRKGILELMNWQRPDSTIFSPVPAGNWDKELPTQMLASVGYYGIWTYFMGTGDRETVEAVLPNIKKYLLVWKTDSQGLVIPRSGGWTWGDWGEDKDMNLLFNMWYAIALQGYERMALLVEQPREAQWATEKRSKLQKNFHEKYWTGTYYRSPEHQGAPDDRAQALAVVSGTMPEEYYPLMRDFFQKEYHASPYMEKYVLEALCRMGYHQEAMNRLKFRFRKMQESTFSTLWEGWGIGSEGYGGGTNNHAWSGGPLTILSQFVAGIEAVEPSFRTFRIQPNPGNLNFVRVGVPVREGIIRFELVKDECSSSWYLEIPEGISGQVILPTEFKTMELNGTEVSDKGMPLLLGAGTWTFRFR